MRDSKANENIMKKAVFPVAGFGTHFLPATKAMPKELLPIVDKPLIRYAVEEAITAGIDTLIFVTGRNKRAIEDQFDANIELETPGKMPMVLIEVQIGTYLGEDDIIRYEDFYARNK